MSHMETFYGAFKRSDLKVEPEDTDEYYDWEATQGKQYVKVKGIVFEFWKIKDLDYNGFMLVIPPEDNLYYTTFIVHWYNGGAGLREVVEALIEGTLK